MQWISVRNRLPQRSDDVLMSVDGLVTVGYYGTVDQRFHYLDGKHANEVTHWADLPSAPPRGFESEARYSMF